MPGNLELQALIIPHSKSVMNFSGKQFWIRNSLAADFMERKTVPYCDDSFDDSSTYTNSTASSTLSDSSVGRFENFFSVPRIVKTWVNMVSETWR